MVALSTRLYKASLCRLLHCVDRFTLGPWYGAILRFQGPVRRMCYLSCLGMFPWPMNISKNGSTQVAIASFMRRKGACRRSGVHGRSEAVRGEASVDDLPSPHDISG